jgi:hypothetical protein
MTDPGYRDVACSFCDRHNRDVRIVAGRDGLTICQVCVAAAAEIIDAEPEPLRPRAAGRRGGRSRPGQSADEGLRRDQARATTAIAARTG